MKWFLKRIKPTNYIELFPQYSDNTVFNYILGFIDNGKPQGYTVLGSYRQARNSLIRNREIYPAMTENLRGQIEENKRYKEYVAFMEKEVKNAT